MTGKRNKNAASIKDKGSTIIEYSARIPRENFLTEFLRRCEEYDVEPLPRFLVINGNELFAKFADSNRLELEKDAPLFHVSFENPSKMENVRKLECKNKEVSICVLDALYGALQKYNTVTVLKLPNCQVNAYGILQIAQMLTEFKCLRDVNLDNNPNAQENHYLLCAPANNLHYLSLRMCKLSDNGVQKLTNELKYRDPPNDPKLIALNVADNDITDVGAEHVAAMLRTNRSLQSLTLTGNKIRDDGASLMIQELCMSALTHEEIVDLRRRRFMELEGKVDLDNQDSQEDVPIPNSMSQILRNETLRRSDLIQQPKKTNRRRSSLRLWDRADNSTSTLTSNNSNQVAEHDIKHPFTRETMAIKGSVMASGNLELQHLSLSYNRLTNKTLKKLMSCLHYQTYMLLNDNTRGLLHVSLEGNNIERNEDWTTFQELLRCRRQSDEIEDEGFEDLASTPESEILRSRISVHR